MQVVDVVLTVAKHGGDLLPAQEDQVAHLKERFTFYAIHTLDDSSNLLLHLYQLCDFSIDLSLQVHQSYYSLFKC